MSERAAKQYLDIVWTDDKAPVLIQHKAVGKTEAFQALLKAVTHKKWATESPLSRVVKALPIDIRIFQGFLPCGHCWRRPYQPWLACGRGWKRLIQN